MAGSIIIPLITGFDDSGVKKAVGALDSVKNKLGDLRKSAVAGIGSALVGAGAVSFIKQSVTAAAALQQNMTGLRTIFQDSTSQVMEFVKASESMGMSQADAAKAVTFIGSVFKQTGMPMQNVIEHTKTMTKLAADMASTYGYDVQEALTAITATFRGEYDPIEKFGVAMKQQQVNAMLAAQGLDKLKGNALIAAQQEARYQMILERTTDAQGAFARSSGNMNVQLAVAKAVMTDVQASLGQKLVPVVTRFIVAMQPLVQRVLPHLAQLFENMADMFLNFMDILPSLADTVATVFDIMGASMKLFGKPIIELFKFIGANIPLIASLSATFFVMRRVVPIFQALRVQFALMKMDLGIINSQKVFQELAGTIEKVTFKTKALTAAQYLYNNAVKANMWIIIVSALVTAGTLLAEGISKAQEETKKLRSGVTGLTPEIYKAANAAAELQKQQYLAANPNDALGAQESFAVARQKYLDDAIAEYKDGLKQIERTNKAWSERYPNGAMFKALYGKKAKPQGFDTKDNTPPVKTWFDSLNDEVAKQASKLKLQKLNLPSGLVDSVLASNDWKTASAKLLGMTQSSLRKVVSAWANTVDGDKASIAGLTARIEYAKQIYKQVTDSVMSYANIAATSGKQVIESYKRMIDGVEVTISKTVDAISGQNIVKHYEDVVAKTKKFYADLQALKASGLNQALFGQIVQAGVDAGSATAEGILSGGQSSVDALNSLFGELQKTSQDLGDISASVMEDTGNNVMSKFIDGLSSQDTALKAKAKYLATVFSKAFKNGVGVDLSDVVGSVADNKGGKGGKATNQYVINVTAGMGTDGAEVGRKIVQAIKAYERNNGSIWMPAW